MPLGLTTVNRVKSPRTYLPLQAGLTVAIGKVGVTGLELVTLRIGHIGHILMQRNSFIHWV